MQLKVKLILSPLGPHVIYASYHVCILAVQTTYARASLLSRLLTQVCCGLRIPLFGTKLGLHHWVCFKSRLYLPSKQIARPEVNCKEVHLRVVDDENGQSTSKYLSTTRVGHSRFLIQLRSTDSLRVSLWIGTIPGTARPTAQSIST
jgi:hypothetical protein